MFISSNVLPHSISFWSTVSEGILDRYLWKEAPPVANALFPKNQFGQYVLSRKRLLKKLQEEMASQLQHASELSPSIYLSGCHGSGKTSLLHLFARWLKKKGYEVYFFETAACIPQGIRVALESLLEGKTKKVAVLIDDVNSNPDSDILLPLLHGQYPHLVTIGAGVPRRQYSASFNSSWSMADIVLKEEDKDFKKLV